MNIKTLLDKIEENISNAYEVGLFAVLRDLAGDIEKVAGMTFNQALSQIIKKK